MNFTSISQEYEAMRNDISDQVLKKIYLKFFFKYISFKTYNQNKNIIDHDDFNTQEQIENFMFNYIKNYKFITYLVNVKRNNQNSHRNHEFSLYNSISSIYQTGDVILCVENECILIDEINIQLFNKIIEDLKEQSISILNIDSNSEVKEEVQSFYNKYKYEIRNNKFVELTIQPIIGFLIRRYFYPTSYFKDPSFFSFNLSNYSNEQKTREIFSNFFNSQFNEQELPLIFTEIQKYEECKDKLVIEEFKEDQFIVLRTIYSSKSANFYMTIHIESLYIFMIKIIKDKNMYIKETEHEKFFCQNYSHRCITKFYGFLKKEEEIVGFVYEFMTNGSLEKFIKNNEISPIFSLMTINRIYQSIDYLHAKNLVHRDLRPANILIDHDFLPYVSDFDCVRQINYTENNSFEEITNDIGAPYYISPEQYSGQNISYSTDIYSFGLTVYFIFKKKDLKRTNEEFDDDDEIPNNIKYLIKQCIKHLPSERATKHEIKNMIIEELDSFYYLENFLQNKIEEFSKSVMINFIYEYILIQPFDLKKFNHSIAKKIVLYRILFLMKINPNDSSIYESSLFDTQDYLNAKNYYEILSKQNNSSALLNLGFLYKEGNCVHRDHLKANEYFELAAKQYKCFIDSWESLSKWRWI